MKFLKFSIAALLMSVVFVACRKDRDVIPLVQQGGSTLPASDTKPVQGMWMGYRYGPERTIPYNFGFQIKAQGKLDVLNPAKKVIGSGSWKFKEDIFTATYTILSSGETFSVKSHLYDSPDKISGVWGHNNSIDDGGSWEMEKIN